jgi:hypothetical protein
MDTAAAPTGGTPILVWLIYGLGLLAATIFAFAGLFVLGAYIASDEVPFSVGTSTLAIVVWGGFIVLALATLLVRRNRGRR